MINKLTSNLWREVGKSFLSIVDFLGALTLFTSRILKSFRWPPIYWRMIFKQLLDIGYYSLPVVGLTAIFTGAVLALQSYTGFARMNAESAVASIVVLSITRELSPVLTGLMLAGRVGAAIAAELGTMRVTDQIDALYTLKTNPIQYLVVPRVLAGIIVTPILVIIADIIGVLGGYLVCTHKLGFNPQVYLRKTFAILELQDVTSGIIKAAVFGLVVCLLGCYHGYNSQGGAQGVGRATTDAVVKASIMVLLLNYLITGLMFGS